MRGFRVEEGGATYVTTSIQQISIQQILNKVYK